MVQFKTILKKFDEHADKTGWTYIIIPAEIANTINPGVKKSFAVKGKLDNYKISKVNLLPAGGGDFMMAINAGMRKAIGKRKGHELIVALELDNSPFKFSDDFIECLNDEPKALAHFKTLPLSHQKYFSKWIESAKTIETKSKRIAMAVSALAKKMGYGEMLRANKDSK